MSKTGNINLVNKLGLNTGNCYSLYAKCVSSDGAKSEDSELLLSSYGITLHNLAGTQSLSDSWMANNESYTITINSLDTSKFRVPTTDTSLWQYNTGGYIKVHRGSTGIFNICTYTLPVGTGYLTFPTDVADGVNNISIEISGAPAEKELRMTGSVTGQFSITCSTQRTSGQVPYNVPLISGSKVYYGEAITYSVTPERGYYVNDLGKTITVDTTNPLIYITPNKLKATYMCDDRCTGYVTFGKQSYEYPASGNIIGNTLTGQSITAPIEIYKGDTSTGTFTSYAFITMGDLNKTVGKLNEIKLTRLVQNSFTLFIDSSKLTGIGSDVGKNKFYKIFVTKKN